MSDACVLDASALLALLNDEAGADGVAETLPVAVLGTVNLAEVVAKLRDRGMGLASVTEAIEALSLDIRALDTEQAMIAGDLRPATRAFGLSLGNRACLALARAVNLPVLTADAAMADAACGVEIRLLR